ncbi:hypothetical protein HPHPH19_0832 [Helicobacter pylori Hp H-19]|nr:hypothetical protein HPHPH19_0832 [Helicobacter pylori Hp H-19]
MSLIKVNDDKKAIEVSIPLTSISGKARVKIRHAFLAIMAFQQRLEKSLSV